MAKVVKVTSADVQRARLLVRVNDSLQRPTPAGIRKIAEAQPTVRPTGAPGPALAQP
ncbi:hypothetical protein SAMN04488543_3606 [Friedmanniella luteola]|uniref:Uncharacterized protein n=1 Tax=Friedmanniella luteola TaxID=546871 RepID=A0A1H1Z6S9_9ACTN|nr:hypothetical protein [Friedmanniella luteola]SDT29535.1 hypothetical protein SAMN04488543_3606 [Friedmanniella luteola]